MDDVIRQVDEAIARREWGVVRPPLHPYLRWTDATGTVRGRCK